MKKILFTLLLIVATILLTACGSSSVVADYGDAESFEAALNNGESLEGKVVSFTINNLETQSAYGYNIWAGDHLNFVSEKNPNVKVGDTIGVKINEVNSLLGSWIIKYEALTNVAVDESTIVSK